MDKPSFSMSKYVNKEDLYKAKAEYYEKAYDDLKADIQKMIDEKINNVLDDFESCECLGEVAKTLRQYGRR